MADSFRIEIDVAKLQANFAAAGEPMTVAQVLAWLRECGLLLQPDGAWICEELDLDLFGKGEIISQREI